MIDRWHRIAHVESTGYEVWELRISPDLHALVGCRHSGEQWTALLNCRDLTLAQQREHYPDRAAAQEAAVLLARRWVARALEVLDG